MISAGGMVAVGWMISLGWMIPPEEMTNVILIANLTRSKFGELECD